MSLHQMGLGKRAIHLLVAVVAVLTIANCAGKRPIQQVSTVMERVSESYFAAEEAAVKLHEAGILTGDQWNSVVETRNRLSPIMRMLWAQWRMLPDSVQAVEDFQRSQNFETALSLIAQIEAIISNIHSENLQYRGMSAQLEEVGQ